MDIRLSFDDPETAILRKATAIVLRQLLNGTDPRSIDALGAACQAAQSLLETARFDESGEHALLDMPYVESVAKQLRDALSTR